MLKNMALQIQVRGLLTHQNIRTEMSRIHNAHLSCYMMLYPAQSQQESKVFVALWKHQHNLQKQPCLDVCQSDSQPFGHVSLSLLILSFCTPSCLSIRLPGRDAAIAYYPATQQFSLLTVI